MVQTPLEVATDALRQRQAWMQDLVWPKEAPRIAAPDGLESTQIAVKNLNDYAEALFGYTVATQQESDLLAAILGVIAEAYEKVDEESRKGLEDPKGRIDQVQVPKLPGPEPDLPPAPPQAGVPTAGAYSTVPDTHQKFHSPGSTASVDRAAATGNDTAGQIEFNRPAANFPGWYGDASEAAGAKFDEFADWIMRLGQAWRNYSDAADAIARVHNTAKSTHDDVFNDYQRRETQLQWALSAGRPDSEVNQIANEMQKLETTSAEVRQGYAHAQDQPLPPISDPPFGQSTGKVAPVGTGEFRELLEDPSRRFETINEDVSRMSRNLDDAVAQYSRGDTKPNTAVLHDSSGGSDASKKLNPSVAPVSANEDPQPGSPTAARSPAGGGAPSGGGSPSSAGSSGGGSPSGSGGSPSGGASGGMPGGGIPTMPSLGDPGLKPASFDGGGAGVGAGAGGGAAGGAGGAGVPKMPLGTLPGGDAMSPTPTGGRGGPAGAGGPGGGMAGGMGGMGHGGGQRGEGKEKRRDPNLSPNEDLYVEDRAHTEAVIGYRPRKGPVPKAAADSE